MVDVVGKQRPAGRLGDIGVVYKPFDGVVGGVHPYNSLQRWEFIGLQVKGTIGLQFRHDIFDNFDVVQMFEFIVEEEHAQSYFINCVGQLVALVGGVDIDHNEISNSGGHLNDHPLIFVVCVYADPIFGFQVEFFDQASCKLFSVLNQLLVGKGDVLGVGIDADCAGVALCDLPHEMDGGKFY